MQTGLQGGVQDLEARSMRMRLHTLSKFGFIVAFVVFIVLFLISVIVGAAGPSVWSYQPTLSRTNTLPLDSQWIGMVNVSKLNQRIFLQATFENKFVAGLYMVQEVAVSFTVSIKGWDAESGNWTNITSNAISNRRVKCREGGQWCGDQYLNNLTIIHRPYIDYDAFEFTVRLNNASIASQFFPSVIYRLSEFDAKFTLFALWFRFIFLLITFIMIIVFAVGMRGYEYKDWTIEQRWCAVLLFGLMGYNNPFFPLTISQEGWMWPFLDQMMLATFLVLLMLFWLVMFDGIRTEPALQTFKNFYLPKLILLVIFWILTVIVFGWGELKDITNPETSLDQNSAYVFFFICMLLVVIIYAFWLSYVLFRAIATREQIPYLSLRLKFFGVFSLFVLIITIFGVLFGAIGPVQNNAAQLLSFLSLFNLYVYILTFVYQPAKDGVPTAGQLTNTVNAGMIKLEELEEEDGVVALDAGAIAARTGRLPDVHTDMPAHDHLAAPSSMHSAPPAGRPQTSVRINFGEKPEDTPAGGHSSEEEVLDDEHPL